MLCLFILEEDMKINEMIMVIENRKGSESNSLCSFEDYLSEFVFKTTEDDKVRAELAGEIVQTKYESNGWSEIYAAANKTIQAKYCSCFNELQAFILGCYNDVKPDMNLNVYNSSIECLQVLESIGIAYNGNKGNLCAMHYEKIEKEFAEGEVLCNFNGNRYRVMEKLTDKNLLLQDVGNGTFVVGVGTDYYAKYPKAEGICSDNCVYGIEWQHGIYPGGSKLSEIDFKKIRQEYGKTEEMLGNRTYREELTEKFDELFRISRNSKLTESVCEAAKEALYDEFGTARKTVFLEKLENGAYDRDEISKHRDGYAR